MKNINSKKAKNEIGKLIFDITMHKTFSDKYFINHHLDNSKDYDYGKLCFYSYKKNMIRLAEEFGINYYQDKSTMKDVLNEKDDVLKSYKQAYDDYQNAAEKGEEK